MPEQLTFDLPAVPALGRGDFFVSPVNALAVASIGNWQNWPGGKMVLVGPKGAGKTHLALVWAGETDACVISARDLRDDNIASLVQQHNFVAVEDADKIAGKTATETALFHLHNLLLAEGGRLLVTAALPPAQWSLGLPDLASRIQASSLATLAPPDDPLMAAILVKLFADRQLEVSPKLITYLVTRMERSFTGAQTLVAALDLAALSQKRAITRPLAALVLDNLEQNGA